MKENWESVTVAQPYSEDELRTRFLQLVQAQILLHGRR